MTLHSYFCYTRQSDKTQEKKFRKKIIAPLFRYFTVKNEAPLPRSLHDLESSGATAIATRIVAALRSAATLAALLYKYVYNYVMRIRFLSCQIMDHGPKVTWSDIAGLEFAKRTIMEMVVWPMLRP